MLVQYDNASMVNAYLCNHQIIAGGGNGFMVGIVKKDILATIAARSEVDKDYPLFFI